MWRKLLLLVAVFSLLLASVGAAYAAPKPKGDDHPGKGVQVSAEKSVKADEIDDDDDDNKAEKSGTGELKGRAFQGTVIGMDGNRWTVKSAGYGDVKVDVSNADIKWPGRKGVTAAVFKLNDRVVVQLSGKFDRGSEWQSVRRVHLVPASMFVHVTGVLTYASDNTVKVKPADRDEMTFNLENLTTIKHGPDAATFEAFTMGQLDDWLGEQVTVVARQGEGTLIATAVVLHGNLGDEEED